MSLGILRCKRMLPRQAGFEIKTLLAKIVPLTSRVPWRIVFSSVKQLA